jgi:hypothetical protein
LRGVKNRTGPDLQTLQIPAETYTEVTRVEEALRREVPAEEDYEAAIDTLFDCGEEIEETGTVLLS